jgi:carbon-monoxide dehydrogenase small subunit
MKIPIEITVNRQVYRMEVESRATLLDLLRDELDIKSLHRGCEEGECGACTVLVNGKPRYSCLVLAAQADKAQVTTVEGLMRGDELHPIMQAFLQNHGVQCGYCTPGMVMTAYYLVNTLDRVTEEDLREGLAGNLCRCTGYLNIIKAIQAAQHQKDTGNWW